MVQQIIGTLQTLGIGSEDGFLHFKVTTSRIVCRNISVELIADTQELADMVYHLERFIRPSPLVDWTPTVVIQYDDETFIINYIAYNH